MKKALLILGWLIAASAASAEHVLYEEDDLPISKVVAGKPTSIEIFPKEFTLTNGRERMQLVVIGHYPDGESADLTRIAEFKTDFAKVNERGTVTPLKNGATDIVASVGGKAASMRLDIENIEQRPPVSFQFETLPVMAKTGCSSAACHGSPHGKAKFALSLHGLDSVNDHKAIAEAEFGRRVNLLEPESSLLLAKPRHDIAHEGGQRLRDGDLELEILTSWIAEGCVNDIDAPVCVDIRVTPESNVVRRRPHHVQQLRVEAEYGDGSIRDITHLASFESSDETVCKVSRHGLAVGLKRGEVAVIIRYLNHIRTPMFSFVEDVPEFVWKTPNPANYIDEHVYTKLAQFQYSPGELCSDEIFLRRIYLDLTGLLPSPDRAIYFLENKDPDKRAKLIDELLGTDEHVAFWTQKWGDLLKLSTRQMGAAGVLKFHRWIHQNVAENRPYDEFARDILLASGSNLTNPASNFYRTGADTSDVTESTAQLFLGTRIGCAKCHNHPYERWTQDNYYGLSAFFNRIQTKKTGRKDEVIVWINDEGEIRHPATNEVMLPWAPKADDLKVGEKEDRRVAFTNWLTSPENPYFAQVEVNRIWAHLLGRGIVEPFDDFRDTNPPSNAQLLEALTKEFIECGFDRRKLIRQIVSSNTYQASSQPHEANRFFSHYEPRRLTAEQLIDALGDLTGVPEKFHAVPASMKATQLPAPDLKPHDRSKLGDIEFLKVFGQPERQSVCECERGDDASLGQALELYNGGTVHKMLANPENRIHRAIRDSQPAERTIFELYLRAYGRKPSETEQAVVLNYVNTAEDRGKAFEDVVWALINKDEFLYQH